MNNVFIIDESKPETLKALARAITNLMPACASIEWVDSRTAREMLSGTKEDDKLCTQAYLDKLCDDGLVLRSKLTPRNTLYNLKSIEALINSCKG